MQDTGVVTIALGAQKYTEYAFNLAASVKMSNPKIPVGLITSEQNLLHPLWPVMKKVFDIVKIIDSNITHYKGIFMPGRVKIQLNELTPFENTLFIDADSIIFPTAKLTHELEKLKEHTMAYYCWHQYSRDRIERHGQTAYWGSLVEYIDSHGMRGDKFQEVSSYFFWWKKSDRNNTFFKTALEIHDGILEGKYLAGTGWRNNWVPDEYPFTIATGVTGVMNSVAFPYQPITNTYSDTKRDMNVVQKNSVGITYPGTAANTFWLNWYNYYAKQIAQRYAIYKPFNFDGK